MITVTSYLESILELLGLIVGLTISIISINGYRKTKSSSLLRLGLAFFLISMGFLLSLLIKISIQDYQTINDEKNYLSAILQTSGYFFLVYSHFMKIFTRRIPVIFPFIVPVTVYAVLSTLSVYFLLYGSIETILIYLRARILSSLIVAVGLIFIAIGEITRWLTLFPENSELIIFSLLFKIIGISAFIIPIFQFRLRSKR